jgi:hypothetical protein
MCNDFRTIFSFVLCELRGFGGVRGLDKILGETLGPGVSDESGLCNFGIVRAKKKAYRRAKAPFQPGYETRG